MDARRHQIIHQVVLISDRPEYALNTGDFLIWGNGFEAECDGLGLFGKGAVVSHETQLVRVALH